MNRGFYDREGNAISPEEWSLLFRGDNRLLLDTARDEQEREHRVSTVWIGLDMGHGLAPVPLIYETMVFCEHMPPDCEWDQEQYRYSNEQQAREGHEETVRLVREGARDRAAR
jgi:hypothetical protein